MEHGAGQSESIGEQLFERGWRQGALFRPRGVALEFLAYGVPSHGDVLHRRQLAESERLIVISQECDLVARTSTEPFVEALLCYVEESDVRRREIERVSARAFVVDPASKLVADARYRVQLDKTLLLAFDPERWPSSSDRLRRFVIWLGRRYTRPAVPDEVYEGFQRPVNDLIRRLERREPDIVAAFSEAVYETRVNYPDQIGLPIDLNVVMMIRGEGLTAEQAGAIETIEQAIREKIDPAQVRLSPFLFRTDDEMSLAEYFATVPLFFDHLTYRGDDVVGLEPPSPA